ncbi:MAG TPA: chemotaxis protein CheA [Devosia sp.]|nr:chemotaxis protein CheA [Devosia sp.]
MSELDEFKATYFDECSELLAELEEQFIAIQEGDHDADRLNAVFRAIHSIKGGAGAFGFEQLVEFAHSFETMLDFVRDGRVEMSEEVVSLCIRSNDLVADFVGAARDGVELAEDYGAEELAAFKMYAGEEDDAPMEEFDIEFTPVMVQVGDDDQPEKPVSETPCDEERPDSFDTAPMEPGEGEHWYVKLTPFARLYERANDPLLLFRELMELGDARIKANLTKMPPLGDFDPFGVYCNWEVTLASQNTSEEDIREVFEFVEGDCELIVERRNGQVAAELEVAGQDADNGVSELGEQGNQTSVPAVDDQAATGSGQSGEEEGKVVSFADLAAEIEPAPTADAQGGAGEKKASAAPPEPAKKASPAPAKTSAIQTIRVDLEKVDRVVNMVGELVITQSMLTQQMDDRLRAQYQELVRGVEVLAQTTRGLQDAVMAIRAQPVKSVFSRMPRLVRELNAKTGKKIRLEMVGEHTEIDKTIIEQLSDPLTHMIRNSADHGIEQPEDRVEAGKPEEGIIQLSAEQSGGNIIIAVEDDGGGINRERVLNLAREKGVVSADQQLSDEQIDELVFAPGFSTASAVSDISGRGVGMDVVISNIKKIGGSVHVRSTPGKGTRMQLRLPLTLAVLDVMLVEVAGVPYVVPLSSIVETLQCRRAEFGQGPSGRQVLQVRGEYVHVIDLACRFGMTTEVPAKDRFVVLCEAEGGSKVALMVDQIVGQQQVVIKSLEENFRRIGGIAGGTILGDGSVALIVDVQGLKAPKEQQTAA